MELVVKRFEELELSELYDILQARAEIFVVEQDCVYNDLDGKDKQVYHVYLRDAQGVAAYVRVLDKGMTFDEVSIGRVITVRRGVGLGKVIMKAGIDVAKEKFGADKIRIAAQLYAKVFYEKVGFVRDEDRPEFLEDGIPHVEMVWEER